MTDPTMASLEGKTALITGASSGVGKALAHELASRGSSVLLVARDAQKLRAVSDAIAASGSVVRQWAFDLTDDQAVQQFVAEIKKEFAGIDFLIHSAGIFRREAMASAPVAEFDALYRTNVRAPFTVTQGLLPLVIGRSGAIAFINSTAGERALAGVGQYAASKHALKALADTLRLEVRGHSVRVLSVMLGRTATPMQEQVCRLEGSVYEPSKFLEPSDVARAVVDALTLPASAAVENLQLRPAHA
jgi:NADP-dependent 3-hydroxy acid dehydrogenase YdfG